jgi:hypothetical protein
MFGFGRKPEKGRYFALKEDLTFLLFRLVEIYYLEIWPNYNYKKPLNYFSVDMPRLSTSHAGQLKRRTDSCEKRGAFLSSAS